VFRAKQQTAHSTLKEPTQNIAAKKRVHWEAMESDYLFGNAE